MAHQLSVPEGLLTINMVLNSSTVPFSWEKFVRCNLFEVVVSASMNQYKIHILVILLSALFSLNFNFNCIITTIYLWAWLWYNGGFGIFRKINDFNFQGPDSFCLHALQTFWKYRQILNILMDRITIISYVSYQTAYLTGFNSSSNFSLKPFQHYNKS